MHRGDPSSKYFLMECTREGPISKECVCVWGRGGAVCIQELRGAEGWLWSMGALCE